MKFRLKEKDAIGNKVGCHRNGEKLYQPGEVVESDSPLDTIFRNKFEKVPDSTPVSPGQKMEVPGQPVIPQAARDQGVEQKELSTPNGPLPPAFNTATTAKTTQKPKKTKHGVDVTDEFPDAALAKLSVYHNPKLDRYLVVDPDTDQVLKKAASEKPVTKFLKEQIG